MSVLFQMYVCVWIFIVVVWMIASNFLPGQSTKEVEHDLGFVMKLAFGWPIAVIVLIWFLIRGIYVNLKNIVKKV